MLTWPLSHDLQRHDILQHGGTQQWLQFRKWGDMEVPALGANADSDNEEADKFVHSSAFRFLSHALTFPLTVRTLLWLS